MRAILSSLLALSASCAMRAHAQQSLYQFRGTTPNERVGSLVASTDDIDGDGVRELIAAGAQNQPVRILSGATGAHLRTLFHPSSSGFGFAIGGAGDVDGDGAGDVIVGSIYETGNAVGSGRARVYSGATGGTLYELSGNVAVGYYGASVDGVGDLDGDGRDEFIVGAYEPHQLGHAFVYSGATGAVLYSLAGAANDSYFGATVAGAGDIDADGTPDFLVSSPFDGGAQSSRVRAYSGATGTVLHTWTGPSTFGFAIDGAGDVDGDGHEDVLVGQYNVGTPGQAKVFSGANGSLLRSWTGRCSYGTNHDWLGWFVAGVGDVDGDGVVDVGIGAQFGCYANVYSGATSALLWHVPNALSTGAAICGLGDVDGDGRADVAVGGGGWSDPGALNVGRVRVFTDGMRQSVGALIGLGDGSGAPCPCGNVGQTGAGCRNSTGFGGELRAFGSTSAWADELYFEAHHLPALTSSALLRTEAAANGGLGLPFGSGLRVAIGNRALLASIPACGSGDLYPGTGYSSAVAPGPGLTLYFQLIYRDAGAPCGSTLNTSNAVEVVFTP